MMKMNLIFSATALACAALFTVPASAYSASDTVTCKDGSSSHGGKGSCSHHGGIDKKATQAAAGAGAAAAPAASKTESAPTPASADASAETVNCTDGSMSHGGKGACSHHGGIKKSGGSKSPAPPAAAAPASAASAAPSTESTSKTGGSDASGATAKCKDGTFSHSKHHSGSCSHHGGVDKFLQ